MLQKVISSKHFTELKAFKRLYTFDPDQWFSSEQIAWAERGGDISAFVPIKRGDPDELRRRRMEMAERQMDGE